MSMVELQGKDRKPRWVDRKWSVVQEVLGSGEYISNNTERRVFQAKRLAWIKIPRYETALSM